MRKLIAAPIVAGLIGMAALAAPLAASAATTPADTGATFAVTGGALTISSPTTSVDLGAYTLGTDTGNVIASQLGTVTVTDNRATVLGSWNASATTTDFTTGLGSTNETVPAADISYSPGSSFNPVNPGTSAATYQAGTAGALGGSTGLPAMSTADESGVGGVSWDPTLDVHLPAQVVAGTYSGTVTHSAA